MVKILLRTEESNPYKGLIYRDDTNETIAVVTVPDLSTPNYILKVLINDSIIITDGIDIKMLFNVKDYLAAKIGKLMDVIIPYEDEPMQRAAITIDDLKKAGIDKSIYIDMNDASKVIKFGEVLTKLIISAEEDD